MEATQEDLTQEQIDCNNKAFPDVIRLLQEARRLVTQGWTQDVFARTRRGDEVLHKEQEPYSFCATGALCYARDRDNVLGPVVDWGDSDDIHNRSLVESLAGRSFSLANKIVLIEKWNDANGRTKKDVLEAFDKAIAYAQDKENRSCPTP